MTIPTAREIQRSRVEHGRRPYSAGALLRILADYRRLDTAVRQKRTVAAIGMSPVAAHRRFGRCRARTKARIQRLADGNPFYMARPDELHRIERRVA